MPGPTIRARRLAQILRDLRESAGMEITEAARLAGCSHMSVWRYEHAETRPREKILRQLLGVYGTGPAETAQIITLAAQSARPGWWHDYDLSASLATYIALETEAAAKHTWEIAFIPGLLQTEAYARTVIAASPDQLPPARVDELTRVRMKRQDVLRREEPLRLWAIIGEQVLHRPVGGSAMMRAQLEHLREAAEAPHVALQVLPYAAGAHPGQKGAFTILTYPDAEAGDVVYCDTTLGALYAESGPVLARHRQTFSHLAALSLTPRDSIRLLAKVAGEL